MYDFLLCKVTIMIICADRYGTVPEGCRALADPLARLLGRHVTVVRQPAVGLLLERRTAQPDTYREYHTTGRYMFRQA